MNEDSQSKNIGCPVNCEIHLHKLFEEPITVERFGALWLADLKFIEESFLRKRASTRFSELTLYRFIITFVNFQLKLLSELFLLPIISCYDLKQLFYNLLMA